MRRDLGLPGRLRWLTLLIMAIPLAMLVGDASAQDQTRITRSAARNIQEEALALLTTPHAAAMPTTAQTAYIENYVLYAFARDAGLRQVGDLTPTERDQAQRLIGAILESAAGTAPHTHATRPLHDHPDHATTRRVIETQAPRYLYVAPPLPPPVVFVPTPPPVFFVNPTPAYVIPARYHKWGW